MVAAVSAVPALSASAAPSLPPISAQSLVAKVLANRTSVFSGSFKWSPDLGIPSVSGLTGGGGQAPSSGSGFSPSSLISTPSDFQVWVDGSSRQRIAAPSSLAESDVVRSGSQAWVWDSTTQHVTRYVFVPGSQAAGPGSGGSGSGGSGSGGGGTGSGGTGASMPAQTPPTPQALAQRLLGGLASSSTVSVVSPETVAGVPAYVLRIAPKRSLATNADSKVAAIEIAVDAANGFPLQVSVFATAQKIPALQVGFTRISFATPAASVFTPPKGLSVTTKTVTIPALGAAPATGWTGYAPLGRSASASTGASGAASKLRKVGSGWDTVAVYAAGSGLAALTGGGAGTASAGATSGPLLRAATTPVSGAWGSGRLLSTSLLDALVLPNGTVLAGFVNPAALEAAAAQVGG